MKYPGLPASAAAHDRAVAEALHGAPPPAPAYAVLRPAQPYDLATPGTPQGLRDVARAAEAGGLFSQRATFAVAVTADGGEVVASLCLRLHGDQPDGRVRRAWVAYVRREAEDGTAAWVPNGAALLDSAPADGRTMRVVGVMELRAVLRGEVYTPPPPRPGPPKLQCQTCDQVTAYSVTTWRPYARHRCATTKQTEGRS